MEPHSRRSPAPAGFQKASIVVEEAAWRRAVQNPERVVARATLAAGTAGTVLLASDAAVKRLNARHRGCNKPTNVLTFEPAAPGLPGDIVLALGTVRREAAQAGRRTGHHLAHLVVHGALHLQGHDH